MANPNRTRRLRKTARHSWAVVVLLFLPLLAVAPRLLTLPVSWGGLLGTLGAVLLVGMLASTGAVLGALRVPLLPALKSER